METATLVDRFNAGDSADELTEDFGLDREQVEEAPPFESLLRAS